MTATFTSRCHPDGSPCIEITVTYALRALDLAQLLASAHRTTDPAELPMLRYTDAVTTLRRELRGRGGDAPFSWRNDFTDDDQGAEVLEAWARGEVARLFPALRSTG